MPVSSSASSPASSPASRRTFAASLLAVLISAATSCAIAAGAPHVALTTSAGDIVLELNPELAPKTVDNFLQYVKSGQYTGTIFHRVIDGFMIQGGGFDSSMKEKTTRAPIPNEAKNGLKNEAYTIAMARTSDPDSATAQFFINVANNAALDYPGRDGAGYCVFGKVIKGAAVVDKIKQVAVADNGPNQNVPVKPIVITSAKIVP
ncbi:MAG: peptidylprolyl isomerase [Herminiimonas sp.]|nr:peptidylprolyl isomerase [Herminiimonas sp.]